MGVEHEHLAESSLCTALRQWFVERGINNVVPVPTGYPGRCGKHVVVMVRREREDPHSTPFNFSVFPEETRDRQWKEQIMAESGLTDEQIPWATIADPYFQESWFTEDVS
ncbi:hypothetical protein DFJ58DRAFT_685616 [Suillus subalutaceus]|uniref:uncharacterized protein n=1 Tax=Suillus subalutaceus TaxID=48586 RepID=UPI001B87A839|nr:uncharacterized protein DFJ58DRAFT_685616 [Suillus subalutaceus]KAG1849184.1 hypothetical protein DFJ58DRAFT_685616 [Suillus subalutaceus]